MPECSMITFLSLLSCESSVSEKGNPDKEIIKLLENFNTSYPEKEMKKHFLEAATTSFV